MEPIDTAVIACAALLFALWGLDMFTRRGVFESPAIPAAICAIMTGIVNIYFLTSGTFWVMAVCGFLALAYLITAFALRGSK